MIHIPPSLRMALLWCAASLHPAWAQGQASASPGASQAEQQAVQWFNMLDRNGDGQLTQNEVQWAFQLNPRLRQQFMEADSNHDGIVTEAEIRALAARRKAARMARESSASVQGPLPPPSATAPQ